MKVACVLITHLRAKVELRRHPSLKDRPAVIVDRSGSRALVVDFFPATIGVSVEMTLEEALSRQAGGVVLEANESSYQRVFHQVLASLQGISDRVERSDLGIAYVRQDGLEDMYDGEAEARHRPAQLRPHGPKAKGRRRRRQIPRLGSSPNKQVSWRHQGTLGRGRLPCTPLH